ncbi:helix-turn-helix domain-containing protein [Amycolatopsis rhizosphaerae]|uniref:Helix-turn-helix domain-containing protein n=1 Tax=Amycolatopsis rhizosphaerae TaxID=2053003 RepID=A0A558DGG5_9PSEU|nr:helix-turn-helix domain-containing protein [Amycolatopsis rhizosphaerae]TVT60125.1 helix-turn-helix domain-containing protein [Amycolatopsis rhizosphaerae]
MENNHRTPHNKATSKISSRPAFYTVREAAELLRVGASTLYRIIREGDFPAIRLRSRYVVPAAALDRLLAEAEATGSVVDPARIAAARRTAREGARIGGGDLW